MNPPWLQLSWLGTAFVLAVGPCLIAGLTAVAARWTRSAARQRTLWQAALVGILLLAVAEGTGTSSGWVQWARLHLAELAVTQAPRLGTRDIGPAAQGLAFPPASDDFAVCGASSGYIVPAADNKLFVARSVGAVLPRDAGADANQRGRESFSGDGATAWHAVWPKTTPDPRPQANAPNSPALPRKTLTLGAWSAVIWLAGTVLLLGRGAWGRWFLWRFCRRDVAAADPAIQQRANRLARRLGTRHRVPVLETSRLASPIACGWRRPVILLPDTLREEFGAAQLDVMLAHELAHVVAGDLAWHLLADLTVAAMWWHPLAWWSRRRWRVAGEMVADEACWIVPEGQDLLAACLVRLARRLEWRPWLNSVAMSDPVFRSVLGQRVQRLLSLPVRVARRGPRGPGRLTIAAASVAWLMLAVSCTAWAHAQVPLVEGATTMKVFVWSWRHSLLATALAAVLSPLGNDTAVAVAAEGEAEKPAAKAETSAPKPEAPAAKPEREGERGEAKREGDRPEGREGREGERREVRREEREREGARAEHEGEAREAARREELMKRRAELETQAAAIRQKLKSLRPDQDADERELKAHLSRMEAQLRDLQPRRVGEGDRPQLIRRLEELKAAAAKAREAGQREVVERLEREIHEVLQRLGERPGDRPRPEAEAPEMQRRLAHVRAAIENLRAAGLNDQAEALARQSEAWMRERGLPPRRPLEGRPGAERQDRPDMSPPGPQLERAIHEMREQMQDLRRQLDEMRRVLQELREKPQR